MTEAVEVAIELALIDRAQAFATANSLHIAVPNISFTPPVVSPTAKYLRAMILPADTATLGISSSSTNQHYGLLQMDVVFGIGGGEVAPRRIAADIISYFIRGTKIPSNGFSIEVLQTPRLGTTMKDPSAAAWMMLPVRIPYNCFAIPA